jgi:hypothetical protein
MIISLYEYMGICQYADMHKKRDQMIERAFGFIRAKEKGTSG